MEELIETVEQILVNKSLSSIQRLILSQSWQGKTYCEMAQGIGYNSAYIKGVGYQLWNELSEACGQKVTKKNLHIIFSKNQKSCIGRQEKVNQQELSQDFCCQKDFPNIVATGDIDFPGSPLCDYSPLYINRPPIEQLVSNEIMQPGCLLRIKAPRKMGKSSLLNRIIASAHIQGYRTAYLDFHEADEAVFASLDKFLRWFCLHITRQLKLVPNLDNYWDVDMGSKVSCKIYFEEYLFKQIDSPVILALNELDRVFQHPSIAQDFLSMLRFWHEKAKRDRDWQQLRLVLVHTTEIYIPFNLHQSSFNVGLTVQLPPFTSEQVQDLAQRYELSWAVQPEAKQRLALLQAMVGGHPYLISLALYHLRQAEMTLDELLITAFTPTGIYGQYLRELLARLEAEPKLVSVLMQVVSTYEKLQLDAVATYKLESMGLIQLDGNQIYQAASCIAFILVNSLKGKIPSIVL